MHASRHSDLSLPVVQAQQPALTEPVRTVLLLVIVQFSAGAKYLDGIDLAVCGHTGRK
jgi:hypothetical protein